MVRILRVAVEGCQVDGQQNGYPLNADGQGEEGLGAFLSTARAACKPVNRTGKLAQNVYLLS